MCLSGAVKSIDKVVAPVAQSSRPWQMSAKVGLQHMVSTGACMQVMDGIHPQLLQPQQQRHVTGWPLCL